MNPYCRNRGRRQGLASEETTTQQRTRPFLPLMMASYILLLLAAACGSAVTFASATWTVTYRNVPSGAQTSLSEAQLARPANQVVQFVHSDVTFHRDLASDSTIMPGSCVSSSQNAYGWNKWKTEMVTQVAVSGKTITMTVAGLTSFSPTENEVVTCYPGEIGSKGKSYAQATLSAEDTSVSFSIIRAVSPPKALLLLADKPEADIRQKGFKLSMRLENDVWDATDAMVATLLASLTCRPPSGVAWQGADCAWFKSVLQTPKYSGFSVTEPNLFVIFVPATVTKTLNILDDTTIEFNLPRTNGERYGLKTGFELELYAADASVVITKNILIPTVSMRTMKPFTFANPQIETIAQGLNGYTITEACLRGKVSPATDGCSGLFWFEVQETPAVTQDIQFSAVTDAVLRSMNETAFYSTKMGEYLPLVPSTSGFYESRAQQRYLTGVAIFLRPLPDYDVSTTDTIEIMLPFNMFKQLEPPLPTNLLRITVTTSPGEVLSWFLPDITQNSLWRGGNRLMIKLGGESFLPTVANDNFFLDNFKGEITTANNGWDRWKSCLLNTTHPSVNFGTRMKTNLVTGELEEVTDYRVITIDLVACPDYVTTGGEDITITIPPNLLASVKPLEDVSMLKFNVKKSPGMYALRGRTSYLEGEVAAGLVEFNMTFLGGEYLVAGGGVQWAQCVAAMVNVWPTDSTTRDTKGWHNPDVRAELITAQSLIRVSDVQMIIRFNASAQYDTRRGEIINVSTMPGACFQNGRDVAASTFYYLTIRPTRGTVRLGYQYPDTPIVWQNNVTESMMRVGGFNWIITIEDDTFDDDMEYVFGRQIAYPYLTTESLEPSGFGTLKSALINPDDIMYDHVTKQKISIPIRSTFKFDVRNDEDVIVNVGAVWTTSQQDPTNPKNSLFFKIEKSAGNVVLDDWYGSTRAITEQDIREGNVWFRFGLLGDQWRAERTPYLSAFASNETSPTAFMALSEQILPSIEFFTFASDDAYAFLTIRLQSNDKYDISQNEVLVLSFPGTTVVSDLAPTFAGDGTIGGKQYITINVVAGSVILSGMTSLNEKLVRQGGVTLLLTLFGEQWLSDTTAAALCVRHVFKSKLRDQLFNTTLLPYIGASGNSQVSVHAESSYVMVVPFSTDTSQTINYDIDADAVDIVSFGDLKQCVKSRIEPTRRPLRVLIEPTEGELRLEMLIPSVVSEVTMRTIGLTMKLQLDGDQWADDVRTAERVVDLVSGLGSLSSSITEPNGFYANRAALLGIASGQLPDARITANTLEIIFHPSPNYNIDNDEVITFSVPADNFVLGGILPSPSTISFTVSAITRTIILIVDPSRPGSMTNGRFDTDNLRTKIGNILSCQDLTRISVRINTTRSDNTIVIPLVFQGTVTTTEKRTNGQLGKYFMAYATSYLNTQAGIVGRYWEDEGAPAEEAKKGDASGGSESSGLSETGLGTMIWGVSAAGFALIIVIGYFVVMRIKQAELGGMVRKGLNPIPEDRYGVLGDGNGDEDADAFQGEYDVNYDDDADGGKEMVVRSPGTAVRGAKGPRGVYTSADSVAVGVPSSPTSLTRRKVPGATNKNGSKQSGWGSSITNRGRSGTGMTANSDDAGPNNGDSNDGGGELTHEQAMAKASAQYKHASRMFEEKLRKQQAQLANRQSNNRDPSNPDLIPKDPLIDRPMSLKEYAHKRLLERDPDARKVQEIVDSARARLRAADDEDEAAEAAAMMKQAEEERQRRIDFLRGGKRASANTSNAPTGARVLFGDDGEADGEADNDDGIDESLLPPIVEPINYAEDRRRRLGYAEDILLRKAREEAELKARERANRRMASAAGIMGAADSDDEQLYGVDARRKATQARIEQMMEGFA